MLESAAGIKKTNNMEEEYYYLKEGEIIQKGDEVEMPVKQNGPPLLFSALWVKTRCAGQQAPDPANGKYRRLIKKTFAP